MKYRLRIRNNLIMVIFCMALLCGCGAQDGIVMEFSGDLPQTVQEDAAAGEDLPETQEAGAEPRTLYVHLCGAVASPGVYQLAEGSRLYEAVELAGGLTEDADATCFNLARPLSDGEQIVALTREETARMQEEGKGTAVQTPDTASGLVNINTASVPELTTVSGIGESRAQAIVAYREKNGSFRCVEDIKKVDGIKEGLFSKIKDKITV